MWCDVKWHDVKEVALSLEERFELVKRMLHYNPTAKAAAWTYLSELLPQLLRSNLLQHTDVLAVFTSVVSSGPYIAVSTLFRYLLSILTNSTETERSAGRQCYWTIHWCSLYLYQHGAEESTSPAVQSAAPH